jgi:peptidoglycan/xylan/chitin deacetylase (PgdA/CDA1 family)
MRLHWDRIAVLAAVVVLLVGAGVSALAGSRHGSPAQAGVRPVPASPPPACATEPAGTVVRSAPLPGGARTAAATGRRRSGGAPDAVTGPRTVALTFDDGPSRWTPQILDILKRERVKATFFVIGGNGQAHPDLVRRAAAEGHLIGNHTWTHTPPTGGTAWSAAKLGAELDRTTSLLQGLSGQRICWFRPPAGVLAGAGAPAAQRGLNVVTWSVDSQDWLVEDHASSDPGGALARQIVARATSGASQDHPVVLLHDGGGYRGADVEALPAVIAYFRSQGYTFVRLDGR